MRIDKRLRPIGWLAFLIAISAAALIALRVTRAFDIYCDWSSSCVDLLVAALPAYVAMLGMTVPALLLAHGLRRSAAHRYLRASAVSCAILAFAAYITMTLSAYDAMWANYGSPTGLDAPRFTPFLPPVVLSTTSFFWPVLLGAAIVLANVVLDAMRLSRVVLTLGVFAGLTLMAAQTLAVDKVAAIYFGVGLVGLWGAALASQTLLAPRRMLSAA